MTTLTYPSPLFPGPPSVAIDIPEDWEAVNAARTTLAARLPREGTFAPNVVVSIEECPPTYELEASFAQLREMATGRGGSVSETFSAELAGHTFVGCDASWPDADVETILQANLFCVVPTEAETAHLVQLTGAVGGSAAESDYDLVRQVIMTTRVSQWSAPDAPVAPDIRVAAPEGGDASG